MENYVHYIGLTAGLLCTISFIPQVLKIYRAKKAEDISTITFAVFSIGIMMWLVYGFIKKDYPIVIANCMTIVLSLSIVIMKRIYSRNSGTS